MNEQFSKLYHLAWNYSEFDNEYQEKPTYERRCVVQSRIFAELIVRECMALCKTSVGNADYNTGRLHCLENIKEHFGVRE
jgi:hypothetical protein